MSETAVAVSLSSLIAKYDILDVFQSTLEAIRYHPLVQEEVAERGSFGCYACIARNADGLPFLVVQFGEMPPEKFEGRFDSSQEKCRRLATYPNHMTSWESRDPASMRYGGAIRGRVREEQPTRLYSVSGFSEALDEFVAAVVAVELGDLDAVTARAFLDANGNKFYRARLLHDHALWQEAA